MANTTTANYGWQMPDPGGSANTWGNTLNATTQAIDQQVFTNAQAGVPVGAIAMFGGGTAPANWLICDGSSLSTSAPYDKLFAVLQYAFGGSGANFNLPNLQERFPFGSDANYPHGSTGGNSSYTISLANLPSHAHQIVDVAHNHGVNQSPHGHGDPGHVHGVNDPTHTHVVPGVALGGGVNIQPGSGFNQTGNVATTASGTGVSIQAAGTGIQAANANISLNASGTGLSTTQAVGSGAAMSIVPSYVALNYIIRYQ
jgi:microcystin-dependent protein